MHPFLPAAIAALVVLAPALSAQTMSRGQLRDKAKEMVMAVNADNPETMINLIDPKLTEMLGGREKALEAVRSAIADFKRDKIRADSAEVGQPTEPVVGGQRMFCVIPVTIHISNPQGRVTNPNYLIAVSADKGKTWNFIDGEKITQENVKVVIPDFPDVLKLPEKKKSIYTPNP